MISGNNDSCHAVGIVPAYGAAIEGVADRADTIILFRDPGPLCAGLAERQYAMKGFRIHAKSCDWGPMAGLVCMDPRLNKDPDKNTHYNRDQNLKAIRGELEEGMAILQNFTAGVMPLVIPRSRLDELRAHFGLQCAQEAGGTFRGTSIRGSVTLFWVTLPVPRTDLARLHLIGPGPRYQEGECLGLFIDHRVKPAFVQEYLPGVSGVFYKHDGKWFEWLIGMTNTDRPSGFKDSVTGDLDLFAVWPRGGLHKTAKLYPGAPSDRTPRAAGHLDQRPLQYTGQEYSQMGNISERVQYIAFQINDAVRAAGYLGGDACSHSDEAQNPFARDLVSCFPPSSVGVIAFSPRLGAELMRLSRVVVLQSMADLKQFAEKAKNAGYHIDLKEEWLAKV